MMIETLMRFFSKSKEETKDKVPQGLCPTCWGVQEYDNVIREMYEDKQIDVNNGKAHYAFIQEFVVAHVDGIRLKKGIGSAECPTCRAKYEYKIGRQN